MLNARDKANLAALKLACRSGHTSAVKILLNSHVGVDLTMQYNETPLYLAAKNGHADITDLLLSRGICDFGLTCMTAIETPLQAAVAGGHTEVVEVFLKHIRGVPQKLIRGGEKPNENTKRGVIPVEISKSDGRRVSAEFVWTERHIPQEVKRNFYGSSPLELVSLLNDPKMIQLLSSVDEFLCSETDIAFCFRYIAVGITPAYIAHEALSDVKKYILNLIKPLQFLSNLSKFNVNHQDECLNSFLHFAMMGICDARPTEESTRLRLQIQLEVIQLLLEKGADLNLKNFAGITPLMIASEKDCCDAIQILFDWEKKSGLKVEIDARDRNGTTALIKAVAGRHVSVMRLLLNHKASVNLYDYNGYTALHTVFYDSFRKLFDIFAIGKILSRRKFNSEEYPEIDPMECFTHTEESINEGAAVGGMLEFLEHEAAHTRMKEEVVNLLLDYVETDVNARDFRGNTPLDWAKKYHSPISSATFKALKNRGAIRSLLDLKNKALIEETMVDQRHRNPLHLLIISGVLHNLTGFWNAPGIKLKFVERIDSIVNEILQRPDTFRKLATATDDKGRTPIHYAVMPQRETFIINGHILKLVKALLKLGSNLNAVDMYGKTLLHYAESNQWYDLLVELGACENIKDKKGHTPKKLKQLRELVTINQNNTMNLPIGERSLCKFTDIPKIGPLKINHVRELSKQRLVEAIRIHSQSPRPQESSEKAIWKIWTQNDFILINRRLGQLKPSVKHFIERLAEAIKEKDWRFECEPTLVGSAEEETKVVLSADFDFNFRLIKFSQFCDPFPHPLGPNGYFQLKLKPNNYADSRSDGEFACFFDLDQCLLTCEVNSRFQIILEDVLRDHKIWKDEELFECKLLYKSYGTANLIGLCKTLRLSMIHPIECGEDDFLFVNILIDIVACVHVDDWWPEDTLPVGISPDVKTEGCTFVFDWPHFDPSKPVRTAFLFSETFARISFAPIESRIVRESSLLMKAAYMVCKLILFKDLKPTYQLKTCLLYCMEALRPTTQGGSETRNEIEFTQKQLAFWVERIMFCFIEFYRHEVYPVYLMPSFAGQMQVVFGRDASSWGINGEEVMLGFIRNSSVYEIYLDLCPDDTVIEIPVFDIGDQVAGQSLNEGHYSSWEKFDREKFIRKLSSRSSTSSMQFLRRLAAMCNNSIICQPKGCCILWWPDNSEPDKSKTNNSEGI